MCLSVASVMLATTARGQIFDSLDAHPPRWYLDSSNCDARVTSQGHASDGGVGGGACETITFVAAHGSEALLVYPIEPVRPLDDLTANISLMSARVGARIGLRVRYPYVQDEETRRPVSVVVYGASYESPGEFASIGVGMIERPLRLKNVAVRRQYGSGADLSDAYVDAIVINAYSGPGTTALRMDQLSVEGLIPIGESSVGGIPRDLRPRQAESRRMAEDSSWASTAPAFPPGKVTRILQHNEEPLAWVRSLGFDAVLLSGPPDAAILSEAIRARVSIYAPPPSCARSSSAIAPRTGRRMVHRFGRSFGQPPARFDRHHFRATTKMALPLAATAGWRAFRELAQLRAAVGRDHQRPSATRAWASRRRGGRPDDRNTPPLG